MRGLRGGAFVLHLAAAGASTGGCAATIPDGHYACVTNAQCPDGFICEGSGFCFRSAVDAGEADLHFDAGPPVDGAPPGDGGGGDAGACTCRPDGNPCTDDPCTSDGACVYAAKADGTPCGGARATCTGGVCGCVAPWAACGSAECTVDTDTDAANCGRCGVPCSGTTPSCIAGVCAACSGAGDCMDAFACTDDTCAGTACVHTIVAGQCLIAAACVAANTPNPANPCQVCTPSASTTAWSQRGDGTACDDGITCNGVDTCVGGDCSHPGLGCVSMCSEPGGCCGEGGEPCCPGGVCSGSGRACEGATSGICRACGATGQICCGTGTWTSRGCSSGSCMDNSTVAGVCG